MNPIFYIDFYKMGHVRQYPYDTAYIWTNWTPRASRTPGVTSVAHMGVNYLLQHYFQEEFQDFFLTPWTEVLAEYKEIASKCLGDSNPPFYHIYSLHKLGYLPIKVYTLPEGTLVPIGTPAMVMVNTLPDFYWLPNYLETLISSTLWKPSTSATMARQYRKLFIDYAREAGETDFGFVDYQGHDFSFRGMSGVEDAILSGLGHLTCFTGTDTIPAILAAKEYYGADYTVGASVPATEHSVMCAGTKDGEFQTFERLLFNTYPQGIVSVVSDTWDLWKVLTDYMPKLATRLKVRDGKVVLRPDSGDPPKILCGDPQAADGSPQLLGTLRLLANAMGVVERTPALPLIDHAGAIYGDSITLARADEILRRTVRELKLSPYNVVLGIGSYTYEYTTRDQYGFAMKATAVQNKAGIVSPIFKAPVTDSGEKKSLAGIPVVYPGQLPGTFKTVESINPAFLDDCAFELVFNNGEIEKYYKFDAIRQRVRAGL